MALFIARFRIATLPHRMRDGVRENMGPNVAAAAVVLTVVTIAALVLSSALTRRARSPAPPEPVRITRSGPRYRGEADGLRAES